MQFETRGDRFAKSFTEIAEELGMTRQGVEYIYAAAVKKLRHRASADWLAEDPVSKVRAAGGIAVGYEGAEETPDRPSNTAITSSNYLDVVYRSWDPKRTVVVSGPYGGGDWPGRRFPSYYAARGYWLERAGRIHEEHKFIPGRYVFRVDRGTHERTSMGRSGPGAVRLGESAGARAA